jgi:O-antigen/teichoic acid export membrane protein
MKIGLLKQILKGSLDVFILKLFGAAAFFIVTILISKNAGPAALGKFQLLSKLILLGSILGTVGLNVFAVRKISEVGENKDFTKKFVTRSTYLILLFSFFVAMTLLAFRGFIAEKFFKTDNMEVYIIFSGIIVFFYSGYSFICQIFRGYGSVKAFAFFRYSWLHVFFLTALGVYYLISKEFSEEYIYIIYFGINIISFIAIFLSLNRYLEKRNYKRTGDTIDPGIKNDLTRSWPMMFSSSLSFITAYTNIFVIGYFLSTYYVGIYSGIQQFMLFFTFVSVALSSYTSPYLAQNHIKKDFKMLRSLYLHSILTGGIILVPIFLCFTLFPGFVLEITFGDKYVLHSHVMIILSIGYFANALSGPAIDMMNMTNNQSKLVLFSIFNVIFSVTLTTVLTWKYSLTGAAIASAATNIFFRALLFYYITNFVANEKNRNGAISV